MVSSSFLTEFFRNWKTTGAIAPSGSALAREIVLCAEVAKARHILELGPGTGALTRAIAQEKKPDCQFLGIEINPSFTASLREEFTNLSFANAAAQEFDFPSYLKDRPALDCVISGLPWAAFPEDLQLAILRPIVEHLPIGGRFVTFAYAGPHLLKQGRHFRELLKRSFRKVGVSRMVWANLPPAFVYVASN